MGITINNDIMIFIFSIWTKRGCYAAPLDLPQVTLHAFQMCPGINFPSFQLKSVASYSRPQSSLHLKPATQVRIEAASNTTTVLTRLLSTSLTQSPLDLPSIDPPLHSSSSPPPPPLKAAHLPATPPNPLHLQPL